MNEKTRSLEVAANDGFNGCSSDDLRAYCHQLNITTKSNTTDAWMVSKLNDAIDGTHVVESAPEPRTVPSRPLNLRSGGKWEGRRRMVRLHPSDKDNVSSWKEIHWDQSTVLVKTDIEASIPYPHYEILKSAIHDVLKVDTTQQPDGSWRRKETVTRVKQIPFDDLGDDPATAKLPCSWIERQQDDCRAKDYYKGLKRSMLIRLLSDMRDGSIDRVALREESDEDIRETVLNALGLYNEAQESEFFLENAA